MSNNTTQNNGIGIFGLLGVMFVGLKLADIITWSWWWVTLPFWGGLALVAIFCILFIIFYVIGKMVK